MVLKLLTITVFVPALTVLLSLLAGTEGAILITFVAWPALLLIFVIAHHLRGERES